MRNVGSKSVFYNKLKKRDDDFHREINDLENLSNSFDQGIKNLDLVHKPGRKSACCEVSSALLSSSEITRAIPSSQIKASDTSRLPELSGPSYEQGQNLEKIEQVIDGIPNILSGIKDMIPVEDSRKLLQNRLIKDYPNDVNAPYVDQFKKDIDRGDTFKRVDSLSGINDTEPQPPTTIAQEGKTEKGVALFKELIKTEEDAQWIVPLQLLANQSTINNLFDAPIMMFNIAAADSQWNDPITGKELVLEAGFSGHHPPINLEIIRDNDSQKIKEVKVHLTGSLDIRERSTDGKEVGRVVKKDAILGELTYSVTLNDQGKPIIGHLESHLSYSPLHSLNLG